MSHFQCDLCYLSFREAMSLSNHKCSVHVDSVNSNRDYVLLPVTLVIDVPVDLKLSKLLFRHRTNHIKGCLSITNNIKQSYSQMDSADSNDNIIDGTDKNIEDNYAVSTKKETDQKQTPQPNVDGCDSSSLSAANAYDKSVLMITGATNRSETEDLKPIIFKTDNGKEYRLFTYQATIDRIMADPPTGGIWIRPA